MPCKRLRTSVTLLPKLPECIRVVPILPRLFGHSPQALFAGKRGIGTDRDSKAGSAPWCGMVSRRFHTPVMEREVVNALRVRPGGRYVDCNVGEGGHSRAILTAAEPSPRVLGLDLDAEAIEVASRELAPFGPEVTLAKANFADVAEVAREHGFMCADGVLFDLGFSSRQVETSSRGFSFSREARLDMRFDPGAGESAYEVVNTYTEAELADIIFELGEDRAARRIAGAIVRNRPIETTTELAKVVAMASRRPRRGGVHPATRTFQALRMHVNEELENLGRGLEQAIEVLGTNGRLAVISYHSLEDRLVKRTLAREAADCVCPPAIPQCVCGHAARLKLVNRRVIRPSSDEVQTNPRSRSARMRVAEKI